MFDIWIEHMKKILEWEKSVRITKERKMGKSCGVGLKHPDYIDIKKNLEHSSKKIINRTINAVYCTGTQFFKNIFCNIDFSGVVTS